MLLEGELTLVESLDYETTPSYELVIEVSDGGIYGDNVLTSTATISITVIDTSEYVLTFDNGGVYNVSVMEETTQDNIVTVNDNKYTVNCRVDMASGDRVKLIYLSVFKTNNCPEDTENIRQTFNWPTCIHEKDACSRWIN